MNVEVLTARALRRIADALEQIAYFVEKVGDDVRYRSERALRSAWSKRSTREDRRETEKFYTGISEKTAFSKEPTREEKNGLRPPSEAERREILERLGRG